MMIANLNPEIEYESETMSSAWFA